MIYYSWVRKTLCITCIYIYRKIKQVNNENDILKRSRPHMIVWLGSVSMFQPYNGDFDELVFLLPYVGSLRFSVPLEIFFLSYWDVLQRLTYTRQLWSLSSGIGHLFIWPSLRVRDTHTWNRAFGNETVTIGHCHWISVLPI